MKCEDCVYYYFDDLGTFTCFKGHGNYIGLDKEPCEEFEQCSY